MSMKTYVKQLVLSMIERQGYALLKRADLDSLLRDARLETSSSAWAIHKVHTEFTREARLAQERSAQELERARAEVWELRRRLQELQQNNRELKPMDAGTEQPHEKADRAHDESERALAPKRPTSPGTIAR
jgi:hypothetical protein